MKNKIEKDLWLKDGEHKDLLIGKEVGKNENLAIELNEGMDFIKYELSIGEMKQVHSHIGKVLHNLKTK